MRTRTAVLLVAGIVIYSMVLTGGLWYAETFSADRGATSLMQPRMSKTQVVNSLGVMYDDSKRGEYTEVDAVIANMHDDATINRVCYWRIAFSSDRFWVGFDADENVVATYLETKSP